MEIQLYRRSEMLGVFYLDRMQPDGRCGVVIDIQEVSAAQMPIPCVVAGIDAGEVDNHCDAAALRMLLIDHCVRDVPSPELTFRSPNHRMTAKTDGSRRRLVSSGREPALEDRSRGHHQDDTDHPLSRTPCSRDEL
jgi:hypothetical protein